MAGDIITAAEFRKLQAQPKQPTRGPAAPTRGNTMYALGRLAPGVMNKTESRYVSEVITPLMLSGELVWWQFEGIKLRLADNTFFTPDFAQMRSSGLLELVDVKGAAHIVTEDARVKAKVAAAMYPLPIFFAWPMGGTTAKTRGWNIEQVGR